MLYRIDWRPVARRQLRKLPPNVAARVFAMVDALAANPRPDGCRKLAGFENRFRVRSGDYRAVYGWMKTVATLRKTRHRGRRRVDWVFRFGLAAYNLVRMRTLVWGTT